MSTSTDLIRLGRKGKSTVSIQTELILVQVVLVLVLEMSQYRQGLLIPRVLSWAGICQSQQCWLRATSLSQPVLMVVSSLDRHEPESQIFKNENKKTVGIYVVVYVSETRLLHLYHGYFPIHSLCCTNGMWVPVLPCLGKRQSTVGIHASDPLSRYLPLANLSNTRVASYRMLQP